MKPLTSRLMEFHYFQNEEISVCVETDHVSRLLNGMGCGTTRWMTNNPSWYHDRHGPSKLLGQ
jgi:hypothetical protein